MLCKQLNALFKRRHDENDLLKSFNFIQFGIVTSYYQYFQSVSEKLKIDPKTFWSFHAIKSKTKRLPAVVTYKDRSASESVDKAALFNELFSSVYSSDNVNYEDLQVDVLYPSFLFEISTTQSEVENILVNLDAKKATGVDGSYRCP